MQPVVVVGAGIAGIACARALAEAGLPVRVLDRAGVAGGRMATAEHAGRPVDVGASYFTVSDPRFEAMVAGWRRRGLARPWTDTFDVTGPDGTRASTGPLRWAAGAGLRGLVADLAAGLAIERREVAQVAASPPGGPTVDGEPAAAVVLAMPDPQARRVLHPALASERAELTARFEPVLALAAGWPHRDWAMEHGMFVNGDPRLSWIADDGSRRGDGAPVLVAHSTPAWASDRLDRPEQAGAELLRALREVLDIGGAPSWTSVHRWTFAKPAAGRPAAFRLWPSRIGACGDGWDDKPRVEAAFLSGLRLGTALATRLAAAPGT